MSKGRKDGWRLAACVVSMTILAVVAVLAILAYVVAEPTPEELRTHRARQVENWGNFASRPVSARLAECPSALIDYLNLEHWYQGFPQETRVATPEHQFVSDVHAAIRELPPEVTALVDSTLACVCLVEELGASAYTLSLLSTDGEAVAGAIVLDVAALDRTANSWASWKEASPFRPSDDYSIEAIIEGPDDDDRKSAIRYILLHEIGHVVDLSRKLLPAWDVRLTSSLDSRHAFLEASWSIAPRPDGTGHRYVSLFDEDFSARPKVRYYSFDEAPLGADEAVAAYTQLRSTSFVTLYGATSPHEDFAESFASYVHVHLSGRPWSIRVKRGGEVVIEHEPCWGTPRCAEKERILRELF